ncbi:ribosomal protein S18-alanine N-acetyltransferase [Chloroflexota bacterium]
MPSVASYVVEPMVLSDLEQIMAIEQVAFSAPWSVRAYRFEITENVNSTMLVVRSSPRPWRGWALRLVRLGLARPGPVLGYAGCWHLVDEIHVSTIAVHHEWRQYGLGEVLLLTLLDRGTQLKARRATLEVRVTNLAAQGLYAKYGFEIVSRQRRYYADDNEDAYIMATPPFDENQFQKKLRRRRAQLQRRLNFKAMLPAHSTA